MLQCAMGSTWERTIYSYKIFKLKSGNLGKIATQKQENGHTRRQSKYIYQLVQNQINRPKSKG